MSFRVSNLNRMLFFAPVFLLAGCALEQWKLSAVSRPRDFEIRRAHEIFDQQSSAGLATNRLLYVEPADNLLFYGYNAHEHAVEITVQVNRDHTVTVAGPRAGAGKQIRILNFKRLSRSIRLRDSGGPKIGASVVIPPVQSLAEEHKLTLLLGLSLDQSMASGTELPKNELTGTLQSVVIYDFGRDLILAEWTRQAEPEPAEKPTEDDRSQ